jgi:hypothetical protein
VTAVPRGLSKDPGATARRGPRQVTPASPTGFRALPIEDSSADLGLGRDRTGRPLPLPNQHPDLIGVLTEEALAAAC